MVFWKIRIATHRQVTKRFSTSTTPWNGNPPSLPHPGPQQTPVFQFKKLSILNRTILSLILYLWTILTICWNCKISHYFKSQWWKSYLYDESKQVQGYTLFTEICISPPKSEQFILVHFRNFTCIPQLWNNMMKVLYSTRRKWGKRKSQGNHS